VHPGAIYLHQGDAWRVTELDITGGRATVEPHDGSEYTQTRSEIDIRVLTTDTTVPVGAACLSLGDVEVVSRITGYRRRDTATGELLGNEDLDLPPSRLVTRAFWYTVAPTVLDRARIVPADWPGALHAIEHAAIGLLPLFTICDRWDVGGVSTALQADTGMPTIFVYDGYPGGVGIAELGFAAARRHLEATLDVVSSCSCTAGCPSCVQSPKCGNGNEPLDKAGAIALLRQILD
jgi:DEAD/DEAH box helicase domain-containing protein